MDCNWLSRNNICNLQRKFLLLVWVPHTATITNICTFVGCIVRNTSEVLDLFNKHPDNVIRFWMSCNRQQHTYTTHDVAMNARHTLASHNAMLYQCDLEIIAAARATATIFFFFFCSFENATYEAWTDCQFHALLVAYTRIYSSWSDAHDELTGCATVIVIMRLTCAYENNWSCCDLKNCV